MIVNSNKEKIIRILLHTQILVRVPPLENYGIYL